MTLTRTRPDPDPDWSKIYFSGNDSASRGEYRGPVGAFKFAREGHVSSVANLKSRGGSRDSRASKNGCIRYSESVEQTTVQFHMLL